MDFANQSFIDVERLIFYLIGRFQRQYGGDIEDLESHAHEIFMEVFFKWDKRRPFTDELTYKLWTRWLNTRSKELHRQCLLPQLDIEIASMHAPAILDFQNFLDSLSIDSEEVVDLVLYPPPNLKRQIIWKGSTPRNVRSSLRQWLKNHGWTTERINSAFTEIRIALCY